MLRWIPYVMVRVTAFFIAGILLGIYLPEFISTSVLIVALGIATLFYFTLYFLLQRSRWLPVISGAVGLFCVLLLGYLHIFFFNQSNHAQHLLHHSGAYNFYVANVLSAPEEKQKSWKIAMDVMGVANEQGWQEVEGKILLYVSKNGFQQVKRGDLVRVAGMPSVMKGPANPNEFDFKRFLTFKNIFHQQFATADRITKVGESGKDIIYYAQEFRTKAAAILQKYVTGKDEQAVVLALVLGVSDAIDNDLQQAYAASGAIHVLAVSGLHVGIIYWLILFLMKPLKKYAWSRWTIAIISIVILWSYAFVTGLSPSVLRAVTMFSFFALAKPFGHRTNIYNTLAASAFVLLLLNPYLIMSVGFQLSYLAVLGIVYVQAPLYRLWEIDNLVGDWVWKITTVSIAAQLATFALGILYFHQFPVYFMVSNLFVIPGALVILVTGILLLTISSISFLATFIGKVLSLVIYGLNQGVYFVEQLPFSLINDIYITTFQSWLLLGVVLSVLMVFEWRRVQFMVVALIFSIVLLFTQLQHYDRQVNPASFSVYSVSGHGAIDFIQEGKSFLFTDSTLLADEERLRFHIRPNRVISGVTSVVQNPTGFSASYSGFKIFYWQDEIIVWIDQRDFKLPSGIEVDYLVIGNNAVASLKPLESKIRYELLILDSSNSSYYVKKISKEARTMNKAIHVVSESGAFHKTFLSP